MLNISLGITELGTRSFPVSLACLNTHYKKTTVSYNVAPLLYIIPKQRSS